MSKAHRNWLLQLTGIPTAAGCERHVVAYMDHPAFVVTGVEDARRLVADFRGGVERRYFHGAPVNLHNGARQVVAGTVVREVTRRTPSSDGAWRIRMSRPVVAAPGDLLTWKLPPPRCTRNRFTAPACDNLAGVAAALAALDGVRAMSPPPDVRLLLTRGEEVGFVGAIGAARHGTVPRKARLLVIENSRSFAESPLGGGPVVRVGDRSSTFDIEMTRHLARVAEALEGTAPGFRWQRRLMPGGTCEATAFVAYGLRAACVCLPLENYHNMQQRPRRIASERIDLRDFAALVRLLTAVAASSADASTERRLRDRLEALYAGRANLLRDPSVR